MEKGKKSKYSGTGRVRSHFLDSGAFTLQKTALQWHRSGKSGRWGYYDSAEFWDFIDHYANFVCKYRKGIDLYANLDVIPNPDLTYRNQKYLEDKYGLSPVPVVHYGTDLRWLERYIQEGYGLIGIGGLVGRANQDSCQQWIDDVFIRIGDEEGKPTVKLHGFGVSSHKYLFRYPWWSVDSSSWLKTSAYGGITVPRKVGGGFCFTVPPFTIKITQGDLANTHYPDHYLMLSQTEMGIIQEWLDFIGVPLGTNKADGSALLEGVINDHKKRSKANLIFYEKLQKALPSWPWPFRVKKRGGLIP